MELVPIIIERFVRSGDPVDKPLPEIKKPPMLSGPAQVDQLLTSLSQLYLDRSKALQAGNKVALQIIAQKIETIRLHLAQL